jgi:Lipopolysaccharide kinase (Kdo/WaaP) family
VTVSESVRIERAGWSLMFPPNSPELPSKLGLGLIERTLAIARGRSADAELLRRSLHASTYVIRLGATPAERIEMFVKLLDAPTGRRRLSSLVRRSRMMRLIATAEALRAAGFSVAPILMAGEERAGRRALIVTARVAGEPIPRFVIGAMGAVERKRRVLRGLGAEIARLHRASFLHGDLTPYNIFVADGAVPRFSFIDNERTVRASLIWERRRLRNLVQLCRLELDGMSCTDRIRIVDEYARAMGEVPRRLIRRVNAMVRARHTRDGQC